MYFDQSGLAVVAPEEPNPFEGLESEYAQTQCVLADGGERFGVSALAFDKHEELLWMGNQGGHVTSYYTGALQKYTSFQAHASEDIRQILPTDEGVLILSGTSLRFQIRRGIPVFTHTSTHMNEMQCMLQMSPSRILIGGHQDKLIDLNLTVCKETMSVDVGDIGCVMLRPHSRFVCAGNPLGRIDLRDPNTLKVEHSLDTHGGSLSDFDVQGNLLVTCGFSNRLGTLAVDRFLMAYDLRMLRAVSPMQTVLDPMYLRFIPSISSRLAVVSAMGQVQLLDTIALAEPKLCMLQMENPGAMCLAFDISATSQALAFGDTSGHIHLFGTTEEPIFNSYSRLTEHADPIVQYHSFTIDDYNTPLSIIPMPIVPAEIPLASDWPSHLTKKVYRKPAGIDPEILRTIKMQGPIGYAPNPRTIRRNQVQYEVGTNGHYKINNNHHNKSPKHHEEDSTFVAIPKRYRKVDVKYNKLGSDDFQFDFYNKTSMAGLEATLPNAYCNAMIQVLYHTEPLRAALLSHLCSKEFCLSCELGFLFQMLLNANQNQPCQPGNFLRAFRTVPEASALGLILSDLHPEAKVKTDLSALIQSWNRFMLHQMHVELVETKKRNEEKKITKKPFIYKETDFPSISGERRKSTASEVIMKIEDEKMEEISEISELFGTKLLQKYNCLRCTSEFRKESTLLACNLLYPPLPKDLPKSTEEKNHEFCDILSKSLCPQQTTPAWCEKCGKFAPTLQTRLLQSLPKLLAVNTGLHNQTHKHYWQTQMEKMISKMQKVMQEPAKTGSTQNFPASLTTTKPCRYGDSCTRPGCRFKHNFDGQEKGTSGTNSSQKTYSSNNWLPHKIKMSLKNNNLKVSKIEVGNDEEVKKDDEEDGEVEERSYELTAVVCYINDPGTPEKRNLIALVKVPDSYTDNSTSNENDVWHLFNDFSICPIPAQEAVWFSLDWKTPCVLYYSTKEVIEAKTPIYNHLTRFFGHENDVWHLFNDFSICPIPAQEALWFSLDWKTPCVLYYSTKEVIEAKTPIYNHLTREVFTEDACIALSGSTAGITFTPLHDNETLKAGDLVAMDAEFVTLNQEEAELRSDGKMSTIKPSQMSVARITCIRGQGDMEGTPFIDDYISTQEQVVDYLTKFSGIKPGDLDANFSSKHLTTLKSTYTKLRYLQDVGVIFVGHGLKNDFRVINLVVAPEQVVDTVLLFHLPHHRMVSLRFLAWHFLGIKIQSETHDSVEDARAALQLYKKYQELDAQGKVVEELGKLYEIGKSLNWKVPEK